MIIQSKRIWVVNTWLAAQVEVEEGKIVNIYPYGEKDVDEDYGDKRIVPGFIDVHTHGAYGFDTNDANDDFSLKYPLLDFRIYHPLLALLKYHLI